MNTNHQEDNPSAVLLTIDTGNISEASIELAVAIAVSKQSRLHGLFIESQDLLRVASLPFTREISFTSAEERPIDFNQMQRSLQATASLFKNSLKQAAQASKIPWSFDYISSASQGNSEPALPVFSYRVVSQRIYSRTPARQRRTTRRILVIEDHSPNLTHALEVVLRQFGQNNLEVTKIEAEPSSMPQKSTLNGYLGQVKPQISLIELKRNQLGDLLSARGACYDCAIVSADEEPETQRELLENLQCPLILVS